MNQRTKSAHALLAFAIVLSPSVWAQDSQPSQATLTHPSVNSYKQNLERYFRLTFRVLDVSAEGKVTNSRTYNEMIVTGPKSEFAGSIRTGDRVPVATGGQQTGASKLVNTEFQYIDIGTKIDANRAEVVDQMLRLHVTADISSMSTATPGSAGRPIIRQTSWGSNVIVRIDKPSILFSSNNSADEGKTELELTAVPVSQ